MRIKRLWWRKTNDRNLKKLIEMEMQRCIQRLDRYTICDQPQKAVFFLLFYIQDGVRDSFEMKTMRI